MLQKEEVKVFIGLGSNIGDGRSTLLNAWQALGNIDGIVLDRLSAPYMTAPVDMTSQHWFTNAVGRLTVSLSPKDLLLAMFDVENTFGRARNTHSFGYKDRSLDLDLLYYGDVIMDTPELTLPHPHIGNRLFVLVPLAELEPNFKDVNRGESIATMERRLRESIAATTSKKQEIIRGTWSEEATLLQQEKS